MGLNLVLGFYSYLRCSTLRRTGTSNHVLNYFIQNISKYRCSWVLNWIYKNGGRTHRKEEKKPKREQIDSFSLCRSKLKAQKQLWAIWGQWERGEPLTHACFNRQTSRPTQETLSSLLWMLSLLPCYSKLSKQMLPGFRGRKRRKIEGGGCMSQVKVMVGGGVALGFEGKDI